MAITFSDSAQKMTQDRLKKFPDPPKIAWDTAPHRPQLAANFKTASEISTLKLIGGELGDETHSNGFAIKNTQDRFKKIEKRTKFEIFTCILKGEVTPVYPFNLYWRPVCLSNYTECTAFLFLLPIRQSNILQTCILLRLQTRLKDW